MSEEKFETIKCPTCGAEYLPVEIFIPDAVFGRPVHIERDATTHKILSVVGPSQNGRESYVCDYCNVPFSVNLKMQFNTKSETKFNFDSDYVTKLKKESIFLNED